MKYFHHGIGCVLRCTKWDFFMFQRIVDIWRHLYHVLTMKCCIHKIDSDDEMIITTLQVYWTVQATKWYRYIPFGIRNFWMMMEMILKYCFVPICMWSREVTVPTCTDGQWKVIFWQIKHLIYDWSILICSEKKYKDSMTLWCMSLLSVIQVIGALKAGQLKSYMLWADTRVS